MVKGSLPGMPPLWGISYYVLSRNPKETEALVPDTWFKEYLVSHEWAKAKS